MSGARGVRSGRLPLGLLVAALLGAAPLQAQSLVPERALTPMVAPPAEWACAATGGCTAPIPAVLQDRWRAMAVGAAVGLAAGVGLNYAACGESLCEKRGLVFPLVGAITGASLTYAVLTLRAGG